MSLRRTFFGLLLIGGIGAGAMAQDPGAKGPGVRPEIGKPIQAAVEFLKQRRGREALAKAREAQAVRDKTPYENYLVERVLGQAAAAAGDAGTAARALETAAASSGAPEGERRQLLAAAAGQYYAIKEYAKASELAARYFRDGGTDRSVRTIYVQSLYLSNNFAAAAKALAADVEAEERAGKPSEEHLQLLANAYSQQRDAAGYAKAMEKLVAYYPKRDYWLSVLHGVVARPGYSDRLAIDLARLKLATGTMSTVGEYVESAQLSLQEGFPMEASKIIEQGYAAGLLGAGPEAERHKRLKDLAAKSLAEDVKALSREDGQAPAGKDGKALFNDGFNYVLHGKFDKGLELMEQGMRLGSGFRRLDHAKLQLGYAYHLAGQNQKAIQAYKRVQGDDGALTLARLWILRLSRSS
jgi:tetratricopeptide (TPR) repeat protein